MLHYFTITYLECNLGICIHFGYSSSPLLCSHANHKTSYATNTFFSPIFESALVVIVNAKIALELNHQTCVKLGGRGL